jgi:hypothetical protein
VGEPCEATGAAVVAPGKVRRHELGKLPPRYRPPHRHHSLGIHPVYGKCVLWQVDSERTNCVHGTSPF